MSNTPTPTPTPENEPINAFDDIKELPCPACVGLKATMDKEEFNEYYNRKCVNCAANDADFDHTSAQKRFDEFEKSEFISDLLNAIAVPENPLLQLKREMVTFGKEVLVKMKKEATESDDPAKMANYLVKEAEFEQILIDVNYQS